jgi:hypothetical protein
MPLIQYFGWVGSVLLAALFALGWCLPGTAPAPASDASFDQKITIRIHSDQKWPERVQFDTARPQMGAAASAVPAADAKRDQGLADIGRPDPFEAFAAMQPGAAKRCVQPPCAQSLTFPNRFHKPPGRS